MPCLRPLVELYGSSIDIMFGFVAAYFITRTMQTFDILDVDFKVSCWRRPL